MEQKERTKKCSNCDEDIPESKLMLHERFCSQNVKRCPECHKPVIIEDQEDHIKEFHTKVECIFCKEKFLKAELKTHQQNCDMQMTECKYCSLELTKKDLADHEYMCGAKTEECEYCHKYIQLKDMDAHIILCCENSMKKDKKSKIDELDKNRKDITESKKESYGIKEKLNKKKTENINNIDILKKEKEKKPLINENLNNKMLEHNIEHRDIENLLKNKEKINKDENINEKKKEVKTQIKFEQGKKYKLSKQVGQINKVDNNESNKSKLAGKEAKDFFPSNKMVIQSNNKAANRPPSGNKNIINQDIKWRSSKTNFHKTNLDMNNTKKNPTKLPEKNKDNIENKNEINTDKTKELQSKSNIGKTNAILKSGSSKKASINDLKTSLTSFKLNKKAVLPDTTPNT